MAVENIDFDQFECITFDCYGTLIDWEQGIPAAVQPVLSCHGVKANRKDIFQPAQKLGLANVWVRRYGARFGTPPPDAHPDAEVPHLKTLVAAIERDAPPSL